MAFDLIVLGAGPAGVGAAYRAARAGHKVVVIERAGRPGGAAGSFEVAGVSVDFGSHRLHPSIDGRILADLQPLLGDDLQRRRRNGRIRLAGRWIGFPLKAGNLVTHLPPAFAARALRDVLTKPFRRPPANDFAGVLESGLGPTMCHAFYWPYARKLWGLDPRDISVEQAHKRVSADSPLKLARKVVRGSSSPGYFWYPRSGFGAISEALADAAQQGGAELRYNCRAVGLRADETGVAVTLDDGDIIEGRNLWSTIPLPALARLASPPAPAAVLEAAGSLEARAMLLVYLVVERDRYSSFDAHYLPEEFTPVTRISEPKNYRDGGEPFGRTVLCAEIPCSRTDRLWSASEEELGETVREALVRAELPDPRHSHVEVRRLAGAYPVYRKGFEASLAVLDEWVRSRPRLLTFGRQGLFAHDNSHHALAMAWDAADALTPDGSFDDRAWAAARLRFESHVVED